MSHDSVTTEGKRTRVHSSKTECERIKAKASKKGHIKLSKRRNKINNNSKELTLLIPKPKSLRTTRQPLKSNEDITEEIPDEPYCSPPPDKKVKLVETDEESVETSDVNLTQTTHIEPSWKLDSFTKDFVQNYTTSNVEPVKEGKQPSVPTSFLSNVLGFSVIDDSGKLCISDSQPTTSSTIDDSETLRKDPSTMLMNASSVIDFPAMSDPLSSRGIAQPSMPVESTANVSKSTPLDFLRSAKDSSDLRTFLASSSPAASTSLEPSTSTSSFGPGLLPTLHPQTAQIFAVAAALTKLPLFNLFNTSKLQEQIEALDTNLLQQSQVRSISQTQKFAQQDTDGDTPLHILIAKNDTTACRSLISILKQDALGIKNEMKQTPLHIATFLCNQPVTTALVSRGTDVSIVDANGDTPLHIACAKGDISLVKAVLWRHYPSGSIGVMEAMSTRNFEGKAAIHIAIERKESEFVRELVSAGCDKNIVEMKEGKTPLMLALEYELSDLCGYLIRAGTVINQASFNDNIALHVASQCGNIEIVELLIDKGSDICVKNIDSMTPKDLATDLKIKTMLDKEMIRMRRKRQSKKR